MKEEWRITKVDCGYEISNLGNIRGIERKVEQKSRNGKPYTRLMPARKIKPWVIKKTGYEQVQLAHRKKYPIHRLVALSFCEGYEDGKDVNHKNGNRLDNRAENLEWVTRAENINHAYRELGRKGSCAGRFYGSHPKSKPVISTDILTGEDRYYGSASEAAADGFNGSLIAQCCLGKSARHKGFKWRYAEKSVVWSERSKQEIPESWEE